MAAAMARGVLMTQGKRVRFRYVNWRGVDHTYVVAIEGIEYGSYDATGGGPHPREEWAWVLHAHVDTRDGDIRPEMGPTRRRTFMLDKIRELEEAV